MFTFLQGPDKLKATAQEKGLGGMTDADMRALEGTVKGQMESATRNKGRIKAGQAGADFWQGTRENLPGFANTANRSNVAAKLGTAHSVMDNAHLAQGQADVVDKTSRLAATGTAQQGVASQMRQDAASMAQRKQFHNQELKESDKAATWNMILGGLNSAVSGASMVSSFANANPTGKVADLHNKAQARGKVLGDKALDFGGKVGGKALDFGSKVATGARNAAQDIWARLNVPDMQPTDAQRFAGTRRGWGGR